MVISQMFESIYLQKSCKPLASLKSWVQLWPCHQIKVQWNLNALVPHGAVILLAAILVRKCSLKRSLAQNPGLHIYQVIRVFPCYFHAPNDIQRAMAMTF